MKELRVRVGTDVSTLTPVRVNDEESPHYCESPIFIGSIVVRLKEFKGFSPDNVKRQCEEYFKDKTRNFSIQLTCRFLDGAKASHVYFGAEFENRINPPMGSSIGLKIARLIDPALEADLFCEKPWLRSPLLCGMNVLQALPESYVNMPAQKIDYQAGSPVKSPITPVINFPPDLNAKFWPWKKGVPLLEYSKTLDESLTSSSKRRHHFKHLENLEKVTLSPNCVYNMEFFGPMIDFNHFTLSVGFLVDIRERVNGQPIRFAARNILSQQTYFIIEFDLVDSLRN